MAECRLKLAVSEQDHHLGPLDAPVMLVQYGDFECPRCTSTLPILENLLNEFRNQICFVYRHFPMDKIHANSQIAALCSEAAAQQAHFWEMHHLLLENSDHLSTETLGDFMRGLCLDYDQFLFDLNREDLLGRIQRDFLGGLHSGVESTPTFYLNGVRVEQPAALNAFQDLIYRNLQKERSVFYL